LRSLDGSLVGGRIGHAQYSVGGIFAFALPLLEIASHESKTNQSGPKTRGPIALSRLVIGLLMWGGRPLPDMFSLSVSNKSVVVVLYLYVSRYE
jgi:hypothetical protein